MTTPTPAGSTPTGQAGPRPGQGCRTPTVARGPGALWHGEGPAPAWGGRRAQEFTQLTLDTYGRTCWLCGLPGATSCDHVIPRGKGGHPYSLANAAPAHGRCNYSRGDRDVAPAAELIESSLGFF